MPEYRALGTFSNVTIESFQHRSYLQRIYFDEIELRRRIRSFAPDFVFSLGNSPTRLASGYQALLLHNAHLVYPAHLVPNQTAFDKLMIWAQKLQIWRGLKFVDLVFCQTDVMRKRFRETFQYDGDVLLLPNAVSGDLIDNPNAMLMQPTPQPEKRFRLFVLARYYTHKNLETIVDCFDQYRDQLHNVEAVLTITPQQHPAAATLLRAIRKKNLTTLIVTLGEVPQSSLPALYAQMDGLLLPTLLESFSGTYLEAMKFGMPILTSDRDFARATCEDAALYFDPLCPQSMRDVIIKLRDNPALRTTLINAGRRRVVNLANSWDDILSRAISDIEARILPTQTT